MDKVRIKFCGLTRPGDIEGANALSTDYIGFVFAPGSRRYVSPEKAACLKALLSPSILAVGVFVDEDPEKAAALALNGTIDLIQLHGREDEAYIRRLRELTDAPLIQAFQVRSKEALARARKSTADYILLDAGKGEGQTFDWSLLENIDRPWFLAGGLTPENAALAAGSLHPYALDVSSGIETGPCKDRKKMAAFAASVRNIT